MILAVAATQLELDYFLRQLGDHQHGIATLVVGVGPVEAAVRLSREFHKADGYRVVINFGVGGGYRQPAPARQPQLLDICLATEEVFGDLGVVTTSAIHYLDRHLTGALTLTLDSGYRCRVEQLLEKKNIPFHRGVFVTVNGCSGTARRGEFLRRQWNGLCENMEGAALARVCQEYRVPMIELRSLSNYVEDRNLAGWRLTEAAEAAGRATAAIVQGLSASP